MQENDKTEEQLASEQGLDAHIVQDAPVEEAEQQVVPVVTVEESLAGFIQVGAILAASAGYKRAAEVWQGEGAQKVSTALVPVLRKYAWGLKVINLIETGGGVEEIALGAVLVPMALATMKAAQADKTEIEADAAKKEAAEKSKSDRVEGGDAH